MWHGEKPGVDVVPGLYYSANTYTDLAIALIEKHEPSRPLYLHMILTLTLTLTLTLPGLSTFT